MRAKVDIELFDNTSVSKLNNIGVSEEFLRIYYEAAFDQLLKEVCAEGMNYTLSIEIEDNTVN